MSPLDKEKLVHGAYYLGLSTGGNIARWDDTQQGFLRWSRNKFMGRNSVIIDKAFVPYIEIDERKAVTALRGKYIPLSYEGGDT